MTTTLLKVRSVSQSFGGVRAVDELGFDIGQGEIVGLIGPNGAGKSTALNTIAGELRPDSGSALFGEKELLGLTTHKVVRLGLVKVSQQPRMFEKLSVLENMVVGAEDRSGTSLYQSLFHPSRCRQQDQIAADEAIELLKGVGLTHLANEPAGVLSGGQRKLLELSRALMRHPKMLLLDEPAAGVHPKLLTEIAEYLLRLKRTGITILLVEHNLEFVSQVVDRVIVMAQGHVLTDGPMDEVRQDPRVRSAYLGQPASDKTPPAGQNPRVKNDSESTTERSIS